MQRLKMKQIADFNWSVAVLIAIALLMILIGTTSHAQHENDPRALVRTAGDDAASQW